MIEQIDKYRPCVGIMLFNKQGHVFVRKRFDSDFYWQMPQGGVNDGEDLERAALRQLLEEVGTDKAEVIAESKSLIYYNLPEEFIPACWNRKYSGQKQRWFLMRFCGEDKDININYTDYPEFKKWRWQDSHCHLIYFSDDEIPKIISRAEQNIVKVLHNICVSICDVPKLLKISSSYDYVYSSVGVHPLNITVENGEYIRVDELVEFTKNQKVISIGETGLDSYESNNRINQKKSFALHIEVARITKLPLVIHTRNADDEMIDMLKSEMKNGTFSGIMHCFASSRKLAYQATDLGLYISFSGTITLRMLAY
ncbi:hydrolase, TatD family [Dictyocaulus viviparus]|uniref:Hydrolase, TatD family n=1 Tax=Dictyocaulus viviparus TaxID=29172 RepID=A0A0D8X915_DICVI|nr:hydrolase, TatD family [Dictyocaulus viviparus]